MRYLHIRSQLNIEQATPSHDYGSYSCDTCYQCEPSLVRDVVTYRCNRKKNNAGIPIGYNARVIILLIAYPYHLFIATQSLHHVFLASHQDVMIIVYSMVWYLMNKLLGSITFLGEISNQIIFIFNRCTYK
jgi:hypothetical protein